MKAIRIVCSALIVLVMLVATLSCAKLPEPEYAGSITESILIGMNENDYAKFSEHFDDAMEAAMPEAVFNQTNTAIRGKIGDYVSKEFWKAGKEAGFTTVYYKTKFTQEPEVIAKVVFREIAGEVYVSGLWFDSPKLRQK